MHAVSSLSSSPPLQGLHPASYDRRLVTWLSVTQLITWGSVFYLFALLIAPVERDLGLSRAQTSLAFSLALLAEGLMAYPVGRWIDRGYERVVMSVGSLGVGVSLLLLSGAQSMAEFYAAWLLLGLFMAATLYTPVFAVVTRRFPHDFRRAIITLTFLGGLASTVFIPLISWLITQLGWRHALWCLAALQCAVCLPLHAWLLRGAPPQALVSTAVATDDNAQKLSLAAHMRSTPFLLIAAFVVLMMAITAALPAHMVSMLRENGMSEAWAIAIPASIGVIQVFGRLLLYFFEHRFDLHLANRTIPCLIPLGLAALLVAPWMGAGQLAMLLVFVLLFGMGNGMLTIVKGTAVAQYVNREHVASLNGVMGIAQALARAAAPLAMGLLWSVQAGYTYGLVLLLVMCAVAISCLVVAQRLSK